MPRRKNVLIDYERLQGLFGTESYEKLKEIHKGWLEEYLGDGSKSRQDEWTDSIAVGSKTFIEKVKGLLGFRAIGREVKKGGEGYQLREEAISYNALLGPEKRDIGHKNTYSFESNYE